MGQEAEHSIEDVIHCKGEFGHGKKVADGSRSDRGPIEGQSHYFLFVGNNKSSAGVGEPKLSKIVNGLSGQCQPNATPDCFT